MIQERKLHLAISTLFVSSPHSLPPHRPSIRLIYSTIFYSIMDSIPDYFRMALEPEFQPIPGNIGQPMYINSGLFSGQYIRVELQELQQADLGRKCNTFIHSVYKLLLILRHLGTLKWIGGLSTRPPPFSFAFSPCMTTVPTGNENKKS
jgi:hypothetical protein